MTYADQLPIIAAQHRAELSAIERERKAMRPQFVMCEEDRRERWLEFVKRVRLGNAPVRS